MRFRKVALLMVGSTILFVGCAQRQYHRGQQQRTYHRSTQPNDPVQHTTPAERRYHADPSSEHPREPSGPIQPVPAPPPAEVSLNEVKGVSFSRTVSTFLHRDACAAEPGCVEVEKEGCQSILPVPRRSYFSRSADFLKRLCPIRKKPSCVVEAPCGDLTSSVEGCVKRKSYFPKYKKGMLASVFDKCIGKKYCAIKDLCVPVDDGCCSKETPGSVDHDFHSKVSPQESHPASPHVNRFEDPFEQPATRPAVPAVPVAPKPVPDVPKQAQPTPPAAPRDVPGKAQPTKEVPPPQAPKGLNPMPEADQAYVEPQVWPRLQAPAASVANVPASQSSWNSNLQSWDSNPPSWHSGMYISPQQTHTTRSIPSNVSPWSTSWQIR